jgi:hypothetical protein
MSIENENRIGRDGRPRGEWRVLRPIKLYKTSYDVRFEEATRSEEELDPETWAYLDARGQEVIERLKQEDAIREKTLSKVTTEERERLELEELILHLKVPVTMSRIMSGRLNEIEEFGYDAETLAKAQPLDPDFMNPLITAFNKRPARREKAQQAIERILLKRRGGEQLQEEW